MKPMMVLIATGVILLLIMVYFGNKSFEGTFESNVYLNSVKYNKTADYIIELGNDIKNVELKYDSEKDITVLQYNFSINENSTYSDAIFNMVELTYPSKEKTIPFIYDEELDKYILINKLSSSFYTIIFYININQQYDVKVLKTVYFE